MSEKTFDILEHLSGRTYPEEAVKVYFDEAAMLEVAELEEVINSETDQDVVASLEEEQAKLREKAEKTALTFHLRGIPYEVKEGISKKADLIEDKEGRGLFQDIAALEASTIKVVNAEGASANFDHDSLEKIVKALPKHEAEVLLSAVVKLSYETVIFERVETNPDF